METILIVEDDRKIAELERDYLESSGYRTVIVKNGLEVIPALKRQPFDLVLLDVMLPGKAGTTSAGDCGKNGTYQCSWLRPGRKAWTSSGGSALARTIISPSLLTRPSLWPG